MVKIIKPSFEVLVWPAHDVLGLIEMAARTCYKSEENTGIRCLDCGKKFPSAGEVWESYNDRCTHKNLESTATKLVKTVMKRKHYSVIEHGVVIVKFISNRGFTHELVRHRLCSFSQESTRYCNYSQGKFGNKLTVIEPWWFKDYEPTYDPQEGVPLELERWHSAMQDAEDAYIFLTDSGLPAQAARGVLPIDVKTEIVITANLREWRHIFKLRASKYAHPDMQRLMYPLLDEFKKKIPIIYDDLPRDEQNGQDN